MTEFKNLEGKTFDLETALIETVGEFTNQILIAESKRETTTKKNEIKALDRASEGRRLFQVYHIKNAISEAISMSVENGKPESKFENSLKINLANEAVDRLLFKNLGKKLYSELHNLLKQTEAAKYGFCTGHTDPDTSESYSIRHTGVVLNYKKSMLELFQQIKVGHTIRKNGSSTSRLADKASQELTEAIQSLERADTIDKGSKIATALVKYAKGAVSTIFVDKYKAWATKTVSHGYGSNKRTENQFVLADNDDPVSNRLCLLSEPVSFSGLYSKMVYPVSGVTEQGINNIRNMSFSFDPEIMSLLYHLLNDRDVIDFYKDKAVEKEKKEAAAEYRVPRTARELKTKVDHARDVTLNRFAEYQEKGMKRFFTNWRIDQRGRCYQMAQGSTAVGNEIEKSVLRSPEPRPLGDMGLTWLYRAIAGYFGKDKLSWNDRTAWARDQHDHFVAIGRHAKIMFVEHVLKAGADSPFQALSACVELHRIDRWVKNGNRLEDYETTLLVGFDATASLAQIIGLMIGDRGLCKASNVLNSSPDLDPNDFYGIMINAVDRRVANIDYAELAEKHNLHFKAKIKSAKEKKTAITPEECESVLKVYTDMSYADKRKKLAKKLLMPYGYGSEAGGRQEVIRDEVKVFFGQDRQALNTFVWLFHDLFMDAMKEPELRGLAAYNKLTRDVAAAFAECKDKPQFPSWYVDGETLIRPKTLKFQSDCRTTCYSGNGKSRRIQIIDSLPLMVIDDLLTVEDRNKYIVPNKDKIKRSLSANLVHSLDAMLLYSAVNSLNGESMALTHDCLKTNLGRAQELHDNIMDIYKDVFAGNNRMFIQRLVDHCEEMTGTRVDIPEGIDLNGVSAEEIGNCCYAFS